MSNKALNVENRKKNLQKFLNFVTEKKFLNKITAVYDISRARKNSWWNWKTWIMTEAQSIASSPHTVSLIGFGMITRFFNDYLIE